MDVDGRAVVASAVVEVEDVVVATVVEVEDVVTAAVVAAVVEIRDVVAAVVLTGAAVVTRAVVATPDPLVGTQFRFTLSKVIVVFVSPFVAVTAEPPETETVARPVATCELTR